ncbi:MAG: hypothetical protein OK457_02750 [Thaumarchaeota archaeon]|nr:hypothetical protein [Nitrososphaerota archaeon]
MQHFLNLEKCSCGAYRYIAIREHKKSYEIYLIHHLHSAHQPDSRKYSKLASIPKHRLNVHAQRMNQISKEKTLKLTFEQTLTLRSVLQQLETPVLEPSETTTESESLDFSDGRSELAEIVAE